MSSSPGNNDNHRHYRAVNVYHQSAPTTTTTVVLSPSSCNTTDEYTALLGNNERGSPSNRSFMQRIPWSKILKSQPVSLLPTIAVGSFIWFCTPASDQLTPTAIRILAVFVR